MALPLHDTFEVRLIVPLKFASRPYQIEGFRAQTP